MSWIGIQSVKASGPNFDSDDYLWESFVTPLDTIPLKDREGNFMTDPNTNPFDLNDPKDVVKEVTYDPETGLYLITEKIGDQYFRAPTYMTFDEYVKWQTKQQEQQYFSQLAGVTSGNRSKSGILDPIANIDIKKKLIDRLFGGNQITIEPQGNIDLIFGGDYQYIQNPNIPPRAQRTSGFLFDMKIKTNIEGKIGDKMNLNFNFDNNSTFGVDNKLKLAYDSEKWSEDEIIKKVEFGNISFPLRSSLIQGTQSLFGFKTELQFGHLKLTGIGAEQRSNQESITIQSGGTVQEFEVFPDEYDENRHFFLSQFNRGSYEEALKELPLINTPFKIVNLQVWVTNDRQESQQLRDIAAIADLGVGDAAYLTNTDVTINNVSNIYKDYTGNYILPDNKVNSLDDLLKNDEDTRKIINTSTALTTKYGMKQSRDFEILKARKLNSSEYTFHPELGFVSLNVRLRPNQVLAVSYQYSYTYNGGNIYQVGEFADDITTQDSSEVIYTRLLKSSTQNTTEPNWDLMMKNVYPLRAAQVSPEDFKFDVFFENNSDGSLTRYIPSNDPSNNLATIPLLDIFNLDNLNSQNDPQPDGVFDFVPGVTILPRTGSIIFPVLEPFGSSLRDIIIEETGNVSLADSLSYPELYDSTIVQARETLAKNRFQMRGEYKSSISSEISLGAFNIPRGSVSVRAGSKVLVENVDYEIEYGTGRLRILNDSYLQAGTPINVSFENDALFGLQKRYVLGARADYAVNKNLNIGGTYLHLFEQPLTQKVNIGDDPINNRIFGFDMNYSNQVPWLTRALDKLPFYSTSEMSNISSQFELAYLRPGHSRAINNNNSEKGGIVLIDDFEGSASGIPLGSFNFNEWQLASTPTVRPEASLTNQLENGSNRALLNWCVLDQGFTNQDDNKHPYTRLIALEELFENKELTRDQYAYLRTFDLSYYPNERGPYNFDPPSGTGVSSGSEWDEASQTMKLKNPEERWAGVMRYINNNDFQALNVEYIEFWLLNPFMDRIDPNENPIQGEKGYLHFNLGNVSEDVLKDNLQFYENGMEADQPVPYQESVWGKIPLVQPKTPNFDKNNIQKQDVGLDGLTDEEENQKYQDYVNQVLSTYPTAKVKLDAANDNFVNFSDDTKYNVSSESILKRLKGFNNPQGNTPIQASSTTSRGKYNPDIEDMNRNNSLDQSENYYDYVIELENDNGEIRRNAQNDFIREVREITNKEGIKEKWYRYQIPISAPTSTVGQISGFRSIQFIRTYMEGFSKPKTFRMGNFELIRNQWRRLKTLCSDGENAAEFSIDAVSIEENSQKRPFNYVLPPGVQRQRVFTNNQQTQQNERSLALKFKNVTTYEPSETGKKDCEVSIYKLPRLDMRLYEEIQMFVHGESKLDLEDGDIKVFLKLGKDFTQNYYEYEIPLVFSRDSLTKFNDPQEIWKEVNKIKVQLKKFSDLKLERNKKGVQSNLYYSIPDPDAPESTIAVTGNPSLGLVKGIQIGIRNYKKGYVEGEVWFNELRLVGLEEKGGVASLAQVDIQLADLGSLSASGSYSSIGYGALDQKLAERSQFEEVEYSVGANIALNKLLPGNLPINLPVFAQHTNQIRSPRWDPYDLDIQLKDKIEAFPEKKAELQDLAVEKTTINTVNLTNVKINNSGGKKGSSSKKKKPMPWDVSNFSASYSYTQTKHSDPIIKLDRIDDHSGSLDYAYSRQVKYWQPFKKVKNKNLALIKNINFNFIPNKFTVSNRLNRYHSTKSYRLPDFIDYTFFDKRFTWDRKYTFNWDLTKGLKLAFDANNQAVIDELRQVGIGGRAEVVDPYGNKFKDVEDISTREYNDYVWDNFKKFGRSKDYSHNISLQYTLPTRDIPFLNWTSVRANLTSGYIWDGASLNIENLGNTLSNTQSRQVNVTLNFDKFYRKFKYLSKIDKAKKSSRKNRSRKDKRQAVTSKNGKNAKKSRKKEREISIAERALIRPLLMVRTANLTYRENLGTTVPGIIRRSSILGFDNQFDAPGIEFVTGFQPDLNPSNSNNWLYQGAKQGWFTNSAFLNQQVLQNRSQDLELKVDLEVYKDLDIDIDFKKSYSQNHIEEFKNVDGSYQQLALRNMGSFEVNYFGLRTLFNRDHDGLFTQFENNRVRMSQRLPNKENASSHPNFPEYKEGYGRQATQVLVPSFLSTYTGTPIDEFSTTFVEDVSKWNFIPTPNWNLSYNGLSKLSWFKDIFSNVSIKHGYRSVLRVNSFMSDPNYDFSGNGAQFATVQDNSKNYYTRFDIPQMTMNEEFSPLIGIDLRTKSDFNLNLEYRKSRILGMDFYAKELVENKSEEFIVGAGMTLENVDIPFLTGSNKGKKRGSSRKSKGKKGKGKKGPKVKNNKGNNLTFNLDFGYRDDVVYNHTLDISNSAVATRGATTYRFNPSVEYDVNKNLTLRLFFDYNRSVPKTTLSFPITNAEGGIVVRFNLREI